MPDDIFTHQRYIDAWQAALHENYLRTVDAVVDAGAVEPDELAATCAFRLARELRFYPGFPDIEVQADEDGGATVIIDALPKSRRVVVEIAAGGSRGRIKLIDPRHVYKADVTFDHDLSWIRNSLTWLEAG